MGVQSDDRGLFFPIKKYSNYINKKMHTDNLLDLLPPEIISFILKYLPEQELKNSRNINNIWEREANLEWHKRMEFLFGRIVQGNYTVKEYYSIGSYFLHSYISKQYVKSTCTVLHNSKNPTWISHKCKFYMQYISI